MFQSIPKYQLVFCLCRPSLNGAIVPADSAQHNPHMKETINSIQTKLDHLYNRTQVNKLLSLCAEFKCKDYPSNHVWISACSGP